MSTALDYVIISVIVSVLGAFLFIASALIFLLEEAVKSLLHFLRESFLHFHHWVLSREKDLARALSTVHLNRH